jgi:hypothetical protein
VSKKKFNLATSECVSSPSNRKLFVAALGFSNFSLDFYKNPSFVRTRPSTVQMLLRIFHNKVFYFSKET